jgi:hypothetical protein
VITKAEIPLIQAHELRNPAEQSSKVRFNFSTLQWVWVFHVINGGAKQAAMRNNRKSDKADNKDGQQTEAG